MKDLVSKLESYDWTWRVADDDWRETPSLTQQAANEIKRLRGLLEMAKVDLRAACTYVEHREQSAAHGLRQSLAKIDDALANATNSADAA